MELQCNMALRWFVGLNLDQDTWDASTFSQNRRRRFDQAGLERLFDDTVKRAMAEGLVSRHVSADGTWCGPMPVTRASCRSRSLWIPQSTNGGCGPRTEMNPTGARTRATAPWTSVRRSAATRPIARARTPTAGSSPRGARTSAYPGYTVNTVMENHHRFLLGLGVELFRGTASEKTGCLALLARAKRRLAFRPLTLGADKGFFHEDFINALLARAIAPHIATEARGRAAAHMRVRMRQRGFAYRLSQRCRKLIEELFGEGKDWHGLRRFRRRGLHRVRQEAHLIGWVLNLKRLAKALTPAPQPT
jgi:hypothetical protein